MTPNRHDRRIGLYLIALLLYAAISNALFTVIIACRLPVHSLVIGGNRLIVEIFNR